MHGYGWTWITTFPTCWAFPKYSMARAVSLKGSPHPASALVRGRRGTGWFRIENEIVLSAAPGEVFFGVVDDMVGPQRRQHRQC